MSTLAARYFRQVPITPLEFPPTVHASTPYLVVPLNFVSRN